MLVTAAKLARTLGPGWLLYRVWYAFKRKSGLLRVQLPARAWDSYPLSSFLQADVPSDPAGYVAWRKNHSTAFFFDGIGSHFKESIGQPAKVLTEAESILLGKWRYFEHAVFEVGFPPRWNANPLTGRCAPADQHWSRMGDFDYGDIKLIWEASRFGAAFALGRAYAASGDERYAAAFWTLVEDWAEHNPPQLGPNWMCGQEAFFRVMAWCFGLHAFAGSPHSTPERIARLAAMLAVHAERIEGNISYALSQRNNHGLSEANGLWTIGLLFPEFKNSNRWRETGRKILEAEALRQIADDGSYIQNSFNYHRLMLHDYLWALRLGELNSEKLSKDVYDRVDTAVEFLSRFTDPETGRVPNYGSNDGALILPLDGCDFEDFRPVLQASHFLLHKDYLYPSGPWDEDLLWLFGPQAAARKPGAEIFPNPEPRAPNSGITNGGYYSLRGHTSHAMVRCANYRHRPGHADQLHFDLLRRGINIACDAGTYLYNGEPPWANALAGTAVHNTVTLNGRDQMTKVSRFLWADWAQGTLRAQKRSDQSLLELWEGEHDGYRKMGLTHRRAILRAGEDLWLIVDDLCGSGENDARLQWLFSDFPYELQPSHGRLHLTTPAGAFAAQVWCTQPAALSLVRAGEKLHPPLRDRAASDEPNRGWRSRYYVEKEPAISLALKARGTMPLRFVTALGAAPVEMKCGEAGRVEVEAGAVKLKVQLSLPGASPAIENATMTRGDHTERLVSVDPSGAARRNQGIHLLLIHQSFTPPGQAGGTRHYELTSRLVQLGHRATIVASDVDYLSGKRQTQERRLVSEQNLDGVRVLSASTYSSFHKSFVHRVISFLSFSCTSVIAALKVREVDVVMGTTPPLFQAASAWLVAAIRRRPFILEVRDLWPEFAIDMGVLKNPLLIRASRWLESFLYARANHLIVNSPAYRDYLVGKGVSAAKITFIPNGVDPEMFELTTDGSEVRKEFGLADKFVVTYAGALGMANDLDTLLRAAHRLRDDPSIHFLLVGDGKERPQLEAAAKEMKLSNVTFTGPRPKNQMPAFLAASDACIAILKDIRMFRTTYPNKVFDYMAAGRPTIVAIDGVIREVVEKSKGGIFVPPGNDAALAEAVERLSRDRESARKMGLAARDYVARNFHRRQQAGLLAALLGKLAETS